MNTDSCGNEAENDELVWLWQASTALYPSIYQKAQGVPLNNWTLLVGAKVREALRVAPANTLVLPYGTFWTTQHFNNGSSSQEFLDAPHLAVQIRTVAETGAAGVIVWGGSSECGVCTDIASYVSTTLGQLTLAVNASQSACAAEHCSNQGLS